MFTYKFFNFYKKTSIFLLFVVIINGIFFNKVKADTRNQNTTSDTLSSSNIHIKIPAENIKNIPIIGYKLIYKTSYASLVDFLENDIQTLVNDLSKLGIKIKNIVMIYIDYEGDNPSQYTLEPFLIKPNLTPEELANYITDEGVKLNLSYINKRFSLPFILTKRKILIGTLINDNISFTSNNDLKVVKFNIPDAKGFQLYGDVSEESMDTEKNPNDSNTYPIFTKEEIIMNRCIMIQYMNLSSKNKLKFIGMMQYYNKITGTYAYFSIPGTLE